MTKSFFAIIRKEAFAYLWKNEPMLQKESGDRMYCAIKQKPSKRLLVMWQVFAVLIFVAVCSLGVIGVLLVSRELLLPLALILSLIILTAAVYLPALWCSMSYTRRSGTFTVDRGVFIQRSETAYRRQVKYIKIDRTPAERLFGICTLRFVMPGGKVSIHGLKPEEAKRLCTVFEAGKE